MQIMGISIHNEQIKMLNKIKKNLQKKKRDEVHTQNDTGV